MSSLPSGTTSFSKAILWTLASIVCFHLAYEFEQLRGMILGFLFCLVPLARLDTNRKAFYFGLFLGLGIYAPQLSFFWTIFQGAAIALWCVLAFWIALFLLLSRQALVRLGDRGLFLLPVLWLGLEFFRSELYYLRFSWLTPGLAFSGTHLAKVFGLVGVYGIGFGLSAIAVAAWTLPLRPRAILIMLALIGTSLLGGTVQPTASDKGSIVQVIGKQMEFPDEDKVPSDLKALAASNPEANVFVLSEYTFNGPVPEKINRWCKQESKYLVVGAHDPAGDDYFNTAFVIGPSGEVVAKQAKSVPIQFFKDGLPARDQKPWESPWGKIGLGVCYDLSYRKVADRLAGQQCQAFIIPTMDVADWGARQHRLHARIAPMRAAELNIPIFRLCSSGISQSVQAGGAVVATAPFPGEGAVLPGKLTLNNPARLPLDHWLGPAAAVTTAILAAVFAVSAILKRKPSSTKAVPLAQS